MAWFTLTHPGLVWLGWVENQSEWQRAGATGAGLASFGRRAEGRGQRADPMVWNARTHSLGRSPS